MPNNLRIDTEKLGVLGRAGGAQFEKFANEVLTPLKVGTTLALEETLRLKKAPWLLTCDSWMDDEKEPNFIMMSPNPKDITWTFPLRASLMRTMGGAVTQVWNDKNRNGSLLDEQVLAITMQSGSLLPKMTMQARIREQGSALAKRVTPDFPFKDKLLNKIKEKKSTKEDYTHPDGLKVFYQFLQLYNVRRMTEDGEPNYIRLIMSTVLFPKLTIKGFFIPEETLSVGESTDSPTSVEWTIHLSITNISPNIGMGTFKQLLREWKLSGGSRGFIGIPNEYSKSQETSLRDIKKTDTVSEKELTKSEKNLKARIKELKRLAGIESGARAREKKDFQDEQFAASGNEKGILIESFEKNITIVGNYKVNPKSEDRAVAQKALDDSSKEISRWRRITGTGVKELETAIKYEKIPEYILSNWRLPGLVITDG